MNILCPGREPVEDFFAVAARYQDCPLSVFPVRLSAVGGPPGVEPLVFRARASTAIRRAAAAKQAATVNTLESSLSLLIQPLRAVPEPMPKPKVRTNFRP